MKNRKIIVTSVILSLITITSIASADFDCSTIDRDQIMTIMEKNKNGETLTTSEETLLTNVKSCIPEKWGERTWTGFMFREKTWSGSTIKQKLELTDEQKAEMEEIQEIMLKKKNWETLTTSEQTKLDLFEENKPKKLSNDTQKTLVKSNNYNNLSTTYKNKLDTAFTKIIWNISSYSDTEKLTTLETLNTKITALKTKIADSSSYSDTKKATYSDIFSYLNDLINAEIDDLDWWEDDITDDIFSDLFN